MSDNILKIKQGSDAQFTIKIVSQDVSTWDDGVMWFRAKENPEDTSFVVDVSHFSVDVSLFLMKLSTTDTSINPDYYSGEPMWTDGTYKYIGPTIRVLIEDSIDN